MRNDQSDRPEQKNGPARHRDATAVWNPLTLPGRAWRRFVHGYYRPWFCQNNYVFRHEGPFPEEIRTDCMFSRYESFAALPDHLKQSMTAEGNPSRLEVDERELQDNATLWIALVDNEVACTVFTRRGADFRRWFVELQPEDVVVFRLRTYIGFRGRGLAPSLMRHALHEIMDERNCAYIDCRTYNKASIRCIEKTGFKRIATLKTISREWALNG
jgi:hypothetical protein